MSTSEELHRAAEAPRVVRGELSPATGLAWLAVALLRLAAALLLASPLLLLAWALL